MLYISVLSQTGQRKHVTARGDNIRYLKKQIHFDVYNENVNSASVV